MMIAYHHVRFAFAASEHGGLKYAATKSDARSWLIRKWEPAKCIVRPLVIPKIRNRFAKTPSRSKTSNGFVGGCDAYAVTNYAAVWPDLSFRAFEDYTSASFIIESFPGVAFWKK